MKQVVQNLGSGETSLENIPVPAVKSGHILVKTYCSLVSLGTEKMLVSFGQSNIIDKAKSQPDKVKQVLNKVKTDGFSATYDAVKRKLDTPIPLGYSAVGEVIAVGSGNSEFKIGDRVVTNGPHAEVVSVPFNLAALIPDNVSYEEAAFTVISSIGLQGIRLLEPKFGETVVVIGLGLIGLLTAQLLISSGCNVIGTDVDPSKIDLAKSFGVKAINISESDPVRFVMDMTNSVGADSVIITASTKSNDVIRQSAEMSRKRGKIVLVGVVGLDIDRSTFYDKELTFQVSCSYGPGRYDKSYEQDGIDYPLPYVRWTEKRNFEAVLNAIKNKQLEIDKLISEKVLIKDFKNVYSDISKTNSIATLLMYDFENRNFLKESRVVKLDKDFKSSKGTLAVIGSGNFTQATLLPALKNVKANIKYLVSSDGLSSTLLAKKYEVTNSSTDFESVLKDSDVDSVLITTRHDLHSTMTEQSLLSGKNVFVEKPLALNLEELENVKRAFKVSGKSLLVGYNRRFSPHSIKIKELLGSGNSPINIVATMNAGFIPKNHWVHDLKVGGGRIIGEACHYFDLLIYFTGSLISEVCMQSLGNNPNIDTDNASILVKFQNGSSGVINYFSNGNPAYPKEKIEIFSQGKNLVLDNFRYLYSYGFSLKSGKCILKTKLDKGHNLQFKKYIDFLKNGGAPLISFEELENSTRASILSLESLKEKKWMRVV